MKFCNKCQSEKPDYEFHKRKASKDGLAAICKSCQRKYDKERANAPHRALARQEYLSTDRGKERARKAKERWANKNKDKVYESTVRYRKENPRKYMAHGKVAYEIKMGNLVPEPCEVCSEEKVHAHHDDYAKPLNVRWLCSSCHRQWHIENGPGLNAE